MNTTDTNKNTAAPSVTIAPRNPARGVLLFVVTLTTHQDVRAYPCRTIEKALDLNPRLPQAFAAQNASSGCNRWNAGFG